jgi:hypothetical protein
MSAERVTVSLPAELRRGAAEIAEQRGVSFSAVVNEALSAWMRGVLLDAWLVDWQDKHGAFSEDELKALAAETGIPYVPPADAEPAA